MPFKWPLSHLSPAACHTHIIINMSAVLHSCRHMLQPVHVPEIKMAQPLVPQHLQIPPLLPRQHAHLLPLPHPEEINL